MNRISEMDIPIVQVGIRSMSEEEHDFIKLKKLEKNIFYAKDIHDNDAWMDRAIEKLRNEVFITFDLDALDPSIMPATGTPEPGGLQWHQALKFLKKVAEKKKIVGFDVVELSPIEGMHAPNFLAALLVYKMIGYSFMNK